MFANGATKSFAFRLFRNFALFILCIVPFFALGVISYQKKNITEGLLKEGKLMTVLLGSNLRPWVFSENSEKLSESLADIRNYHNIESVAVYNAKGELIHQERNKSVSTEVPPLLDPAGLSFEKSEDGSFLVTEAASTLDITSPVLLELSPSSEELLYLQQGRAAGKASVIGYVRVGLSKDVINREIRGIIVRITIGFSLALFAGLVILFVAIRNVTMPLVELADYARKLGQGEPVGGLKARSDDEIGRLALTFNTMAEDIRKREAENAALNDKLKQSEKLQAIGRLARGIAHDFNNILSTVQGSIYLIEKKYGDNAGITHYTESIRNSLLRSRDLIQSLVIFSMAKPVEGTPVELNSLIRRLSPMIRNMAGEELEVLIAYHEADLTVLGDPTQIERVILNLCINARDAMKGRGQLSVAATIAGGEEAGQDYADKQVSGSYAAISISDSGAGMAPDLIEKIFEPFFTTKEIGKGSGLGLSIVYGIVEQHKGFIRVESSEGKGSVFRVLLPLFENRH